MFTDPKPPIRARRRAGRARKALATFAVATAAAALLAMSTSVLTAIATAVPAAAVEILSKSGKDLEMIVNKGQLIRLPRPAQTVFIANPVIADIQVKSPRLVYVLAKRPGSTTLIATDANENVIANMTVVVDHNLQALRDSIRELYPDANVKVSRVGGSIVLDGRVPSAVMAQNILEIAQQYVGVSGSSGKGGGGSASAGIAALGGASGGGGGDEKPADTGKIINRIMVDEANQVNLRVRVVEVTRGLDKQFGFNWSLVGAIGNWSLGLATFNPFNINVTQHIFSPRLRTGSWDINPILDAMEEEGLVTVLAEPNLTAMSGETASFLAGGEFPILVPEGTDRVIIDFKKFGVLLAFTPTVVGSRINLHVRPEVSELSNDGAITVPVGGGIIQVPALTSRRAETVVELGSGQSFAIAGLIKNNINHDITKFPGLGDVPVLGALFRSDRFQRDESELVIIVTPYIVKPTMPSQLATPMDGYSPPSDAERWVTGGTFKRKAPPQEPSARTARVQRLVGPVGFQLD
ncbi:MAG: type II and III secretion system protein family protein [Hyphomicrobiales bacterium]|nr:type II and III secretion system protein family protein [Hyphomicrobiales bacterium]MCP5371607.1 type II and III secretion system protein family protein [Hyphomicrobiales bacterium]